MEICLANHSSYPRVGASREQQRLRRAYAQRERGEISPETFNQIQDSIVAEVIQEQTDAGCDLLTDGQIRWYDSISHLAGKLTHVEINGLLRYFDTNFYFRQPVITGKIGWREPLTVEDFRYAKKISSRPVKSVLTGPYTLAISSIRQTSVYGDVSTLVIDFGAALAQEVNALAAAGAEVIQVEEPAILKHPQDLPLLQQALAPLNEARRSAVLALYTYFGDATPVYEALQELPVQILGLDFTYAPRLPEKIAALGSQKTLGLGLVDGRNTRMETAEHVFPILDRILPHLPGNVVYVNPSCGVEYLPRDKAVAKLRLMKELKGAFLHGRKG
ncbi:MAG: methylcobamide--CoM methyltransferase [Candidatus Methylomirabilales bacterium]